MAQGSLSLHLMHKSSHLWAFQAPFIDLFRCLISPVHIVVVINCTIQVKIGLFSKPNFVYPILKTVHSFCYSVAHFSTSLLVCVRKLVACGYILYGSLVRSFLSIRYGLVLISQALGSCASGTFLDSAVQKYGLYSHLTEILL